LINPKPLIDFIKPQLPALVAGFVGGILTEPLKAWFIEPLKARALTRQRVRTMRADLYRSLSRDIALLNRLRGLQALQEGTPEMAALRAAGTSPSELMEKMMNGRLLEDFHTETYDDWRRAYPTEYHLLKEADHIRDFYRRLKSAVDFGLTTAPIGDKIEKFLYAYEWVLAHVRTRNLDEKLLRGQIKEVEIEFEKRRTSMDDDMRRRGGPSL
jgi:hypothetical protein